MMTWLEGGAWSVLEARVKINDTGVALRNTLNVHRGPVSGLTDAFQESG